MLPSTHILYRMSSYHTNPTVYYFTFALFCITLSICDSYWKLDEPLFRISHWNNLFPFSNFSVISWIWANSRSRPGIVTFCCANCHKSSGARHYLILAINITEIQYNIDGFQTSTGSIIDTQYQSQGKSNEKQKVMALNKQKHAC